MDGIINLNKPTGITSAKALYRVRSLTGQRKSGHAGSLDPAASGVLVLCLGRATKLVEAIMDQPKVYRAVARLDVTSESFDADRPLIPVHVAVVPTTESVRAACRGFVGTIEQTPPTISAIKIGGVPAYKRRADAAPLVLSPRRVTVYWIHLHAYAWPNVDFELCCGRGTYVRALIRDVGERLGTGGCLTSLVRRQVGPFTEGEAWTLEALKTATLPDTYLIELNRAAALLSPAGHCSRAVPQPPAASSPEESVNGCTGHRRQVDPRSPP